jgi:hypothetical protein
MEDSFFRRIIRRQPVLFPIAALFLVLMTVIAAVTLYPTPLFQRDWLRPLSMLLFTITWLFVCDLRKWAATGFILLTMLALGLQYFSLPDSPGRIFASGLFPLDMILSIFILVYFKRFR